MNIYNNIVLYVNCSSNIKEKISRIDAIITVLEDSELNGAVNSDVNEYWLDDGQTKIKTVFRDPEAIERAILALQRRKIRLQNQCAGHRYGLMDGNVL